ncbi:MAG: DNA-binding response OmpR family regulator [Myxococcota bacterium]
MSDASHLLILHVEDNDGDALLFRKHITHGTQGLMQVERVRSLSAAYTALDAGEYGLAVVDLTLPDSMGLPTVQGLLDHSADLPVVVLTGRDDLVSAARAIRLGVQDVLFKGNHSPEELIRSLILAVERANTQKSGRQPLSWKAGTQSVETSSSDSS